MNRIKVLAVFIILLIMGSGVIKAQEEDTSAEKRFKAGAIFSLNSIGDSNFKNVYGSSFSSFGMDFGYMITENIEAWATVAFGSKSATIKGSKELKTKFKFKPMMSLNLRYHILRNGGFSVFGGGGLTAYQISDKVDSADFKEVKEFMTGFNLHAGCRYNVAGSLYLQGVYRYNFISKSKKEWTNKLDLKGSEILFGAALGF